MFNLAPMTLIPDDDPNLPSLSYQAEEHVPLYIPWTPQKSIAFGTGLDSSAASKSPANLNDVFRRSALSLLTSPVAYHFETAEGNGSFRQNSTTSSSSSYEHLNFGGSISVGNKLLSASVRGSYAKDVYANRDASKVSSQSSIRVGHIVPRHLPGLSPYAFNLLQTDPTAFHATYGDYFLGGITLGAECATLLSTSSALDLQSEMKSLQVEAKLLWMKKKLYDKTTVSRSLALGWDVAFSGFDTLSASSATVRAYDERSYAEIRARAAQNLAGGMNLDQRVLETLQSIGLGVMEGQVDVSEEQCEKVWMSGLVVELLFLPYAGLRDYISATSHPIRSRSWDAYM